MDTHPLITELESFLQTAKRPLLVALGPTASGKTGLSLKLAQQFQGEIISTDSRQIYKEMEIGTDAIPPEEQDGVPHHLLGITTPDQTITMAEYKDLALEKIEEIYQRGNLPMLVGGTGLYISAIIQDYAVPRIPPNRELRAQLEKEAKEFGYEHVHKQLAALNSEAAANIHPNNLRYVIRAIEVAKAQKEGRVIAHPPQEEAFDTFLVGIQWPREELYARIELRVERQLKRGLVKEVKQLLEKGYSLNLPSMSSLGVKEIVPYINGEASLEECTEILKRNTRRYAKRQISWFKRYDDVHWLAATDSLLK